MVTYRQLKAALDRLSDEQLDKPIMSVDKLSIRPVERIMFVGDIDDETWEEEVERFLGEAKAYNDNLPCLIKGNV